MDEIVKYPARMLILDRGFVIVGRCPPLDECLLRIPVTESRTVQNWGTNEGLAELVNNGPLPGTVLNPVIAEETIPTRAILRMIELPEEKWASLYPRA